MSVTESLSWADEERYDVDTDHVFTSSEQERRRQLAQQLEKRLNQRSVTPATPQPSTPLLRLRTPSSQTRPDMEDVKLQFMDQRGSLKPGGTSSVIPNTTYYRARSANSSYSANSKKSDKKWRYFNAELSKYINHEQPDKLPSKIKKNAVFFEPNKPHTKGEDLKSQCSLSNKLLNVMTIDDYQERYYGRKVKSSSKFGHRISRASSASTRSCTSERRPVSAKTDSRPGSTKRPTSSNKAESGIYDVESECIQDEPTAWRDMPLEYFAMLEEKIDSENAVVSKGFDILLNSNECVRNTSSKLYRENTNTVLSNNEGSEFFKRLKATLRYQLLVGDGLPSKSRYQKALKMHEAQPREEQELT